MKKAKIELGSAMERHKEVFKQNSQTKENVDQKWMKQISEPAKLLHQNT